MEDAVHIDGEHGREISAVGHPARELHNGGHLARRKMHGRRGTLQTQLVPARLAEIGERFLDLLLSKRRKLYGRDHRWKTCSLRRTIGRSGDLSRGQKSE